MRNSTWIGLAIIGCVVVLSGFGMRHLDADYPVAPTGSMIALTSDLPGNHQQVTVIDSKARVMSVYHIETATGVISLKSVRDISADLMMDEFNTESPLPREIRAILTSR